MSDRSAIEWTDATWNPVRGCSKLSAGCKFCYAEVFAERFRGVPGHPFEQGFDLRLVPQKLNEPIGWRKPRRIFVNSMSDLFHEDIPIDYLAAIGDVMLRADWHVYQVLTRRHERMHALLTGPLRWMARLPHVWFGVSVENRKHGLPRLAALRETPASVRFVSMEPVLEDLGTVDLSGIDWAIVGGESGAHARPMARDWVVGIRQQCQAQGVAFFFKPRAACSMAARTTSSRWSRRRVSRRRRDGTFLGPKPGLLAGSTCFGQKIRPSRSSWNRNRTSPRCAAGY